MNDDIRMGGFQILPPVVKNLLIINGLFFLATIVLRNVGIDLEAWLGLHYFTAKDFHLWQPITYMFMHANFGHLFFNMFSLWMFGAAVENYWGAKRFLIYYFITGIGAGFVHYAVIAFQYQPDLNLINAFLNNPDFTHFANFYNNNDIPWLHPDFKRYLDQQYVILSSDQSNQLILNELSYHFNELKDSYMMFLNQHTIVGASGAVFGLLLAFGMLFPESRIYLYFLIPIKAKWFIIIFGGLELIYGITGTADGIGHFAHLGGMLFGIILILLWRKMDKQRNNAYDEWY